MASSPASSPVPSAANLFIGTSGWSYPTWKPGFYPPTVPVAKFLAYYASQLNSVEVNYSFRKLPTSKQLATWLPATSPEFRFSFKAPQRITHFSRLLDCDTHITDFLTALEPMRDAHRLGLLLFQLPPNFKAMVDTRARLASLLALPALAVHRLAFEFRHESWFDEPTCTLLRDHNAALCVAESDDLVTPEVHTASTHVCFRLRRNGGYTAAELEARAAHLQKLAATRQVYAYLKHEDEPTGALNALALRKATESL